MTADLVIRGGTVIDGSGAAGRVADVAVVGRADRGHRAEARRCRRTGRFRMRRGPRLHRHPHPLRRPGLLGSGAEAVVVPRGDHRGGRQLWFLHRPVPARAPRRHRPHAGERGGDGRQLTVGGDRLGIRDLPRLPRPGGPAGDEPQLHRLHRTHRPPALRHGRRRLRAGRQPRGDRTDVPAGRRGHAGGGGRPVHQLLVRPPGCRRQAGAEPIRRDGRGRGSVHGGGEGREGRGTDHSRMAVRVPGRVHLAAAGGPAVHLPALRPVQREAPRGRPTPPGGPGPRGERLAAGHARGR